MRPVSLGIVWAAAVVAASVVSTTAVKHPIILVPGFTGASLEYSLHNKKSIFPGCPTDTGGVWDILWIEDDVAKHPLCWVENMEVQVTNGQYVTTPGVDVRARDFGGVQGLMYLDTERKYRSYYGHVVNFFTAKGYVVGTTLFGATYDWRFAAERRDTFYSDLKTLVEDAHRNTSAKVAIFSHSLGPSVVLEFLFLQTQAWKDEHIAAFMAITPTWSGSPIAAWESVSALDCHQAWNVNCPGIDGVGVSKYFMREVADALPSTYWTMPLLGGGFDTYTWGADEMIVQTKTKIYTAANLSTMFVDLGLIRAEEMYKHVQNSPQKNRFTAPGVNTWVFYGSGLKTPSNFIYAEDFVAKPNALPPQASKILYDSNDQGDLVVPVRSALRSKLTWPAEQAALGKTIEHKEYKGMSHFDTGKTLEDIYQILEGIDE